MVKFSKLSKKIAVATVTALVATSTALPAYAAATNYTDSVASVTGDIAVVEDEEYSVTGSDVTQSQKSAYTQLDTSSEDGDGNNFVESTYSHECTVYATQSEGSDIYSPDSDDDIDGDDYLDGSILISVPSKVILSGTKDDAGLNVGKYIVKVKGNIAGTTVISVAPTSVDTEVNGGGADLDESKVQFYMGQSGKKDIVATVEQSKTKFVDTGCTKVDTTLSKTVKAADSFSTVDGVEGTISTDASAGSWQGAFNFDISMDTVA